MAAPLSVHHIRPPLSSDNSILKNPTSSSTTIAATATTAAFTANSIATTNDHPIHPHPCLALLDKCANVSQLKQIHAQLLRTGLFFDAFTASKIVAFCALQEHGSLRYARLVFTQISNPTTFTCNSIIRGYTNRGLPSEAMLFYQEMLFRGLLPDRDQGMSIGDHNIGGNGQRPYGERLETTSARGWSMTIKL
ncbi:hypothetical protein FEM48_Zijuj12G0027600 [Ziziphus jujuba var. spinosa]|uniref:Pentatricopeptide repeat-containing protein n=1 Tax=Ziziphus jujuba var. spinosa TaxID=714518 RepID=A0A978UAR8_ZIZJJ|nr:hypothetical protein FEM48_Zijuj12G0027600 [Ziziphus jujuba var. spinosa]